jgi:tetratricopeptide (TPR) repeat protein
LVLSCKSKQYITILKKSVFLLVFSLVFFLQGYAQTSPPSNNTLEGAAGYFSHNNFLMALPIYKELLKKDPNNTDLNYKVAICYLNTQINKSQAIPYMETVTKDPACAKEAWFDMGKAYHYGNKFSLALKAYTKYKQLADSTNIDKVDRCIEMCNNARELLKYPLNITFENLGKEVNSEYPDYYPMVPADESFVIFTSRKKEAGAELKENGYYSSDIYIATNKDNVWSKPKSIGPAINTRLDDQAVGLSPDGKNLVVYNDSLGNISLSENKKTFQKPIKLNKNINEQVATSGSFSSDGTMIFFASNRPEGLGETDIYMSRKLPNGQWGLPQNLGANINTKYKEDFPHLGKDGKTLYFSSQGHSSMGDFDLFKAEWDIENNTWSAPKNLGYPLNTADDDRNISFADGEKVAYVSASRPGGAGDLDIYRVTFNGEGQRYTVMTGRVIPSDSTNTKIVAKITVSNASNLEEFKFVPIPSSGKYVMALPPGKYTIMIESEGYKTFIDNLVLYDMGSFSPEVKRDFRITKN